MQLADRQEEHEQRDENVVDECADEGAKDGAGASQDRGQDHLQRVFDLEHLFGQHEGLPISVNASGQPGHERAEGKSHDLGPGRVDPHHIGGVLILADGHPAIPHLAIEDKPGEKQSADSQEIRHIIEELPAPFNRIEKGQGDARRAAGEARPAIRDLAQRGGDGHSGDGEIVSLETQNGQANEDGEDHGGHRTDEQGREETQPQPDHAQSGAIGSNAEKGHIAERGVAGVAADEIPADGHGRQQQDQGQCVQPETAGKGQEGKDAQKENEKQKDAE